MVSTNILRKDMSKVRIQTAQQRLNNFLRSDLAKTYPLCGMKRLILHALASYTYYKNDCDPSLKSISDYIQFKDTKNIAKHLDELAQLCLIEIIKKNGRRNSYIWLIPDIGDELIYAKKGVDKKKNKSKPGGLDPPGNQVDEIHLVH